MSRLLEPLTFSHGPEMKNRFMLAPLTNLQSHENGVLSDEEFHWLTMRARGGWQDSYAAGSGSGDGGGRRLDHAGTRGDPASRLPASISG